MMGMRKMAPDGYEYLTRHVACADQALEPGESLSDFYMGHGYPPGEWFGSEAAELGLSGEVTSAQMNALFGEGRHPDADAIEAEQLAAGATARQAVQATKLGRRFPQYDDGVDELRSAVIAAYKQHNQLHGRAATAHIDDETRTAIRRRVQRSAFSEAHDRAPVDETELRSWLTDMTGRRKQAVAGYEMVFSAPKSVSLAWALGDEHTRERVVDIHRQAVKDTITHLESHAAFTRQGSQGEAQVDVRGVTAAVFEHWDSRAGDPHLHTHVPISTKVRRDSDGAWTSLDGRTIHAATVTMSEFYDARVRDLFREQGASFTQRPADGIDVKRPGWELDGISNELLRGFSQRNQQVEADRARRIVTFRAEHGREPSPSELKALTQAAQRYSRGSKLPPRSLDEHVQQWRGLAMNYATPAELNSLGQRVFAATSEPVSTVDITAVATDVRSSVSEYHAHFSRWNIEAEAYRHTAGMRLDQPRDTVVAAITDAVLDADGTLSLQAPTLVAEPASLRRANGESVFTVHNAQRYTTEDTLRKESELVDWARSTGGHRVQPATADKGLRRNTHLNPGQRELVADFALSGRRMQLALAPAGSGKTTAMRVFADAWRADGGRVYAFGPSARAAEELGTAIDATPHTLHEVRTALHYGTAQRRFDFRTGDVLIVDEAAMAGTHTLHSALDYALQRGADVRLIGDDRQLGAVEAGGAVRLLAQDVGATRLNEVVRFHDPAQAVASLQIRHGNPAGLRYYVDQEWVHAGSRETMRDTARSAWRADLDAGRETLLILPSNEDVTALNMQARLQRQVRGAVDIDNGVPLHDGTHASRGDWIVTRDNNRLITVGSGRHFLKNGDTWHVHEVAGDGSMKVSHRDHGSTAVLPSDYVASYVELAYAATIHRTQGMTVGDSAHNLVTPGETREQLYTGITRSKNANHVYAVTHQHTADAHTETPPVQQAEEMLIGVLRRSSAETSATEELRCALGQEESLATLLEKHTYAAHLGAEARYDQLLTQHSPESVSYDGAHTTLLATLRTAEDHGWQAERLVPQLSGGDLADVDNPAAVLNYRVSHHIEHHEPPARVIDPDQSDINRWRSLVETVAPDAPVESSAWNVVWRHAAAGAADGLDADAAVAIAAQQLTTRPATDPMDEHRYVAQVVVDQLAEQRADGAGWNSAVPWMARPHESVLNTDSDLAEYLRQVNSAISTRVDDLRHDVAQHPPEWTSGLGPRPERPDAAMRWDDIAGLAAAYRETYGIASNDPQNPVGGAPGDTHQAYAWQTITDQWRPPVTTPDDETPRSELDQRIADLRAQMHTQNEDEDQTRSSARRSGDDNDPYDDEDDLNLHGGYGTSSGMGSGL